MLHRFLNFPHIVEAITETFLFEDLFRCALVNRSWNKAISPVLYLDIITYSLHHDPKVDKWYTTPYFITPESFQGLHKHARHVHAITCKGASSLLAVLEAECMNLLEVNYISEEQNRELGLLGEIVAQNPDLCSVSIEELNGDEEGQRERLQAFVTFLDDYPKITSFYMRTKQCISGEARCPSVRAKRTRKSRTSTFWPGREKTTFAVNSKGLEDEWSYGRFDRQHDSFTMSIDEFAVLAKGEVLEVSCDNPMATPRISYFERFPYVCHVLHAGGSADYPLPELRTLQLREVDVNRSVTEVLQLLCDPPPSLSAVNWEVFDDAAIAQDLLSRSRSGALGSHKSPFCLLVSLTFSSQTPMEFVLLFLRQCPSLQVFIAKMVIIKGSEPDVVPSWASHRLMKLRLGFWLNGQPNDAAFAPYTEYCIPNVIALCTSISLFKKGQSVRKLAIVG